MAFYYLLFTTWGGHQGVLSSHMFIPNTVGTFFGGLLTDKYIHLIKKSNCQKFCSIPLKEKELKKAVICQFELFWNKKKTDSSSKVDWMTVSSSPVHLKNLVVSASPHECSSCTGITMQIDCTPPANKNLTWQVCLSRCRRHLSNMCVEI